MPARTPIRAYSRPHQDIKFQKLKDSKDEKKSARGILAQYADPSLQEKEQYAWEKAVTEKHGSA